MQNKKSAKSWIILGIVLIVLVFVYVGLSSSRIIQGSYGFESIVSVLGFCGFLFLIIGVIKFIIEKRRDKQIP
jgi:hypothetical protein